MTSRLPADVMAAGHVKSFPDLVLILFLAMNDVKLCLMNAMKWNQLLKTKFVEFQPFHLWGYSVLIWAQLSFQLHTAAANGYVQVAEFLLEHHVSLDVQDDDSWQPIHAAACWGHVSNTVYHMIILQLHFLDLNHTGQYLWININDSQAWYLYLLVLMEWSYEIVEICNRMWPGV